MNTKVIIASLITAIFVGWLLHYVYKFEYRDSVLEVTFINLPKGRSVFIKTPLGKTILIDGGSNGAILRELSKLIPFYKKEINIVVARMQSDRSAGGLLDVLDRYDVGHTVVSSIAGTATSTAFESFVRSSAPLRVMGGDVIYKEGNLVIRTVFPSDSFEYSRASQPQLVMELIHGDISILLLGDATPAIQNYIAGQHKRFSIIEFANSGSVSKVSSKAMIVFKADIRVVYSPKLANRKFVSDGKTIEER
jgi:hypothetical protein